MRAGGELAPRTSCPSLFRYLLPTYLRDILPFSKCKMSAEPVHRPLHVMHFRRNNLQELLLLQIVVRRDPLLNPFEFVDAFSVQFEGRSALRSSVITFSKCLEKRGKVEFVEQVHLVLLAVPEVHPRCFEEGMYWVGQIWQVYGLTGLTSLSVESDNKIVKFSLKFCSFELNLTDCGRS